MRVEVRSWGTAPVGLGRNADGARWSSQRNAGANATACRVFFAGAGAAVPEGLWQHARVNDPHPAGAAPLERIHAASRGDAGAAEELLERYQPELVRYLARGAGAVMLARESPEDLAQSVCREVLGRLRGGRFEFRGEPAFREWLYRAAMMKVVDRHRRWTAGRRDLGRESPLVIGGGDSNTGRSHDPATDGTPSRAAAAREELDLFQEAYAELPERQRDVLRMHHLEGLPHGEIATQLGLTEAHCRVLLSRALARVGRRISGT